MVTASELWKFIVRQASFLRYWIAMWMKQLKTAWVNGIVICKQSQLNKSAQCTLYPQSNNFLS